MVPFLAENSGLLTQLSLTNQATGNCWLQMIKATLNYFISDIQ
jgi:hypothetical protein